MYRKGLTLWQAWKLFSGYLNKYGIPVPLIRDPKTGYGSVSLTLVFISFNTVVVGLVGKWAGSLGGIDINQALNLFYACAALYWGRKLQPSEDQQHEQEPLRKTQSKTVDDPDQA